MCAFPSVVVCMHAFMDFSRKLALAVQNRVSLTPIPILKMNEFLKEEHLTQLQVLTMLSLGDEVFLFCARGQTSESH